MVDCVAICCKSQAQSGPTPQLTSGKGEFGIPLWGDLAKTPTTKDPLRRAWKSLLWEEAVPHAGMPFGVAVLHMFLRIPKRVHRSEKRSIRDSAGVLLFGVVCGVAVL